MIIEKIKEKLEELREQYELEQMNASDAEISYFEGKIEAINECLEIIEELEEEYDGWSEK